MPALCLYFYAHQPTRLRRFSYLDSLSFESGDALLPGDGGLVHCFDQKESGQRLSAAVRSCYQPMASLLNEMVGKYHDRFRCSLSLSGTLLKSLESSALPVLQLFKQMREADCLEVVCQPYYHSLASLFDEREFVEQVKLEQEIVERVFGSRPRALADTELSYCDRTGRLAAGLGFDTVLSAPLPKRCEGKSSEFVYHVKGSQAKLLLRHDRLSEDLILRFGERNWECFPITADKFAHWIHSAGEGRQLVNLFLPMELFGEWYHHSSGALEFLRHLPEELWRRDDWHFLTVSEAAERFAPVAEMMLPLPSSAHPLCRDLSAWAMSGLQSRALVEIYRMEGALRNHASSPLREVWRVLQDVHYFLSMTAREGDDWPPALPRDPLGSYSDAYIYYMNIIRDLEARLF